MNQQLIDDLKATRRLLETHGRCTGTLWDVKSNNRACPTEVARR